MWYFSWTLRIARRLGKGEVRFIIYIYLFCFSSLSSITKAVWYFSWTLGVTRWLVRSWQIWTSSWCWKEKSSDLLYIYLFWLSSCLRVSLSLGDSFGGFGSRAMTGSLQTFLNFILMSEGEEVRFIIYLFCSLLSITKLRWLMQKNLPTQPNLTLTLTPNQPTQPTQPNPA
jgi:hypothetical protein